MLLNSKWTCHWNNFPHWNKNFHLEPVTWSRDLFIHTFSSNFYTQQIYSGTCENATNNTQQVTKHVRIQWQWHMGRYFYIVTYVDSHLHTCTYICRIIHNDTTTKTDAWRITQEDFFNNIFPLTLFVRVRKGCSRFACERVLETEHKLHILTPLLWPSRCVFLVLLMLGSTPSGLSEEPLGWVWLSLPHLVSRCLEFYWQLLWHPTQLNYIIIQRPHDRPLDLWNRMFNRHQAEITVMQFTGHSLPVHHCSGTMGPSPCPIS